MERFFGFMIFSTLEYIAFFCLLLVLFRFELKGNIIKFVIFSFVLSFVSNTLFTESLRSISPILHVALFIFIVVFSLRVHIFSAAVMVIPTYVIWFTLTWVLIALAVHFEWFAEIAPYTPSAFTLQSLTALIMFLFALFTYLRRGGFSFINHRSRFQRDKIFVRKNLTFIIFMVISILTIFMTNFMFAVVHNPPYLAVSIVLIAAILTLVLLAIRKDENADG